MLHPAHLGRLEEWTARWRDQVRLLRQVEVPGLVAVRGGFVGPLPHAPGQADESTATLYLVMEWVDGVSLDQWARSLVDPEPEQLLLALVPVAAALGLLHSGAATGGQPVVHRDAKSSPPRPMRVDHAVGDAVQAVARLKYMVGDLAHTGEAEPGGQRRLTGSERLGGAL